MRTIDLNCDLGEGMETDAALMPLITSANIACGAHAGDDATMRATVELAQRHGVAIGAHPGYADREHFGRRERDVGPRAAAELVLTQVWRLQAIARAAGTGVRHIKLHGALYNQVARDRALAEAVVGALEGLEPRLMLYVLAGSVLEAVARARGGFGVVPEVFADRTYQTDGSLTPRDRPGAVISDETAAVAQVLRMVREGRVRATDGTDVAIVAGTVCLHGDGARPVAFARRLRAALLDEGIGLRAPGA